jgi:hypothetical protein
MMGFAARLANVGREPLVPGHTASANQPAGIGPEEKRTRSCGQNREL